MTTVEVPQHMRALERANATRMARATLKRAIYAGERTVAEVLSDVPEEASSMPIMELLRAQRRWGRVRAQKFLGPAAIGELKQVGSLTARQRRVLVAALEGSPTAP